MVVDLTGQRFGFFTAVEAVPGNKKIGRRWRVVCDCGSERLIQTGLLTAGARTGCSCRRGGHKHGLHGTRLYKIWTGMKARCYLASHDAFSRYGARGIAVCAEWKTDFSAFASWALSAGYADDLQIDRIDNDGNYDPANCRWTTSFENMNNRGCCNRFVFNGVSQTIPQAAKKYGLSVGCLRSRISRGMTPNEAVSVPVNRRYPAGFRSRVQYRSDPRCAGL